MSIEVLDPTHESGDADDVGDLARVDRPSSLDGLVVGLLSNGKKGTVPFFDAVEEALRAEHGVAEVVRVTKGNYSAPAEDGLMDRATRWYALIAGIGD